MRAALTMEGTPGSRRTEDADAVASKVPAASNSPPMGLAGTRVISSAPTTTNEVIPTA